MDLQVAAREQDVVGVILHWPRPATALTRSLNVSKFPGLTPFWSLQGGQRPFGPQTDLQGAPPTRTKSRHKGRPQGVRPIPWNAAAPFARWATAAIHLDSPPSLPPS